MSLEPEAALPGAGLRPRPSSGGRGESGWLGMALFAAAEATLVGAIIGSYFYLRFESRAWPPPGFHAPGFLAPLALTAALALSLVPFRAAVAQARAGRRGRALALLAAASAVQAVTFGLQIHVFLTSLPQLNPQLSAYASIEDVLVGAGDAHLALGLLLDLWLLTRLATRLSRYRVAALQAVSLYWLVITFVTVAITITELSPRL